MSRLVFNRRACLALGASALAALAVPRTAGAWVPTRPVAPWVPWAAGGTTDIPLRILAELAKCDQDLNYLGTMETTRVCRQFFKRERKAVEKLGLTRSGG